MDIYNYTLKSPAGENIPLRKYHGKLILIVNTATKCGLTPQLEGLELLHQKFQDHGLVIIGCPCNQFGGQEPESNETVEEACRINYGVSFQLTEKLEVNGKNADPVFKNLKKNLGGFLNSKIKWNFTKFLIDRDGKPVKRFAPTKTPAAMENDIIKYLNIKAKNI